MKEFKELMGKRIFVKLLDGGIYSGFVDLVTDDGIITMTDKFGNSVMFSVSQIKKLEEQK